ncbi:permease, partial [Candidatus Peregrinibacteria bacterium]|nr:permease [Candidatus Peregrinibacteria bacterium]
MESFWLKMQDSVTIFMGVVLGALPFILFGVIVSAALAHFVKEETLLKLMPKNRWLALIVACLMGFLFPVCECGNIPVARRLIRKGIPVNVAITFLLAAPVFNPITVISTWAAFSFMPEIVFFRLLFTFIIAVTIGLVF